MCATKAFYINDADCLPTFTNPNSSISYHQGHRFDSKNHNWFIFQKYIHLPFSYMTFVIKNKIEINDELLEGNVFHMFKCFDRKSFYSQSLTERIKVLKWP